MAWKGDLKVDEVDPFIRFYCDNCGYKSTVSESYAGKNIRCPKCYNIIFIPAVESTGTVPSQRSSGERKTSSKNSDIMIKSHCKNCGRKFSVPQIHAGKKGRCPKCKNIIVVPKVLTTSSFTEQTSSPASEGSSKSSAHDLTLLDVPEKEKIQDQPIS